MAKDAASEVTGQAAVSHPVDKAALLSLALIGGVFGAHKFYLGKYWQGILYFIFSWTIIPAFVAFIEFLIYVFTKRESLQTRTAHLGAGIAAAVLGYGGAVGIGLVALSGSNDFRNRARVADAMVSMSPWREAVAEYYGRMQRFPSSASDLGAAPAARTTGGTITLGDKGVISVTLPEKQGPLAGKTMTISPAQNSDGTLSWKCSGTVDNRYRPASCRD